MKKLMLVTAVAVLFSFSAQAADVGVKACDDYIAKYEACLAKMPQQVAEQSKAAVEQMRSSWKAMAGNAQGKSALEQACAQASEAAKASYSAMGCEF